MVVLCLYKIKMVSDVTIGPEFLPWVKKKRSKTLPVPLSSDPLVAWAQATSIPLAYTKWHRTGSRKTYLGTDIPGQRPSKIILGPTKKDSTGVEKGCPVFP